MKLYYHKTTGGAEYLCSSPVSGISEGSLKHSQYIVRIDGDITKDAELIIKRTKNKDDRWHCDECQTSTYWNTKDYAERGTPVCLACGDDMVAG